MFTHTKPIALVVVVLALTLASPPVAAASDGCAGGGDAPGTHFWSSGVWADLATPASCTGGFGAHEVGPGGDGDEYDWYKVEAASALVATSITVTVCVTANDSWGTIGFAVYYHDGALATVSDAVGAPPPTGVTPSVSFETGNGECETQAYTQAPATLPGGRWYIEVQEGLGACCSPSTQLSYTLDVVVSGF